jgi:hypothetical protein
MQKTYIIPKADVIEVKTTQFLMASLTVNTTDELEAGDILAPEGNFDFTDEDDLSLFGK